MVTKDACLSITLGLLLGCSIASAESSRPRRVKPVRRTVDRGAALKTRRALPSPEKLPKNLHPRDLVELRAIAKEYDPGQPRKISKRWQALLTRLHQADRKLDVEALQGYFAHEVTQRQLALRSSTGVGVRQLDASVAEVEANRETVRNDRQMVAAQFESANKKATQYVNMLSSVMKTMSEMSKGITRNLR